MHSTKTLLTRAVGTLTAATAVATLAAAPAEAALVSARYQTPSGTTNGCRLDMPAATAMPGSLSAEATMTCPRSADMHREATWLTLSVKNADGSRSVLLSAEISRMTSVEPITSGGVGAGLPCSQLRPGTHRYRIRFTSTMKQGVGTTPYVASTAQDISVTCPAG